MNKKLMALGLSVAVAFGALAIPAQVPAANAAVKTISRETLESKLEGGWLGALWGNFTGLPTEFQFVNEPGPESALDWAVSNVYVTDDDTSFEYTFLHMMEVYGADDITYADMPAEWIYHFQDMLWVGNLSALELMKQGYVPPETGKAGINRDYEAIDAQIECEIFGMITPGMLQNCYGRTKWWMAAVGDGVVLENAAFYAMLCSDAFFSDNILDSLARVRTYFDDSLTTAKIYDAVKAEYDANPNDWRAARRNLHNKYYTGNVLDCRINFAATLLALFYGGNDYEKTVGIGVLAGYDNDCNAATAGTIMGIMKGIDNLPESLLSESGDYYLNTNRPGLASNSVAELADRIATQAEQVILNAGGVKNGNEYLIYDAPFTPNTADSGYVKSVGANTESWTYSGMNRFYNPEYPDGTGYGTTRKGAYAEFEFEGDEVTIVGTTSCNGGSFKLSVDGKDMGTLSLKAEELYTAWNLFTVSYAQPLRKLRGLGEGKHTVRLTALEEGKWHSVAYAEVPCTEEEYFKTEGLNFARTAAATPICSVLNPLGTGAGGGGIGVIRDGKFWSAGMNSGDQYDTFLGRQSNGSPYSKDFEDYVGYTFSRRLIVSKLVFNEGGHWGTDGGWFANGDLRIEVKIGGSWQQVSSQVTPAYPGGNTRSDGGGDTFVFTFDPVEAEGIRLIGAPGGNYKLISCGELEVYGGAV